MVPLFVSGCLSISVSEHLSNCVFLHLRLYFLLLYLSLITSTLLNPSSIEKQKASEARPDAVRQKGCVVFLSLNKCLPSNMLKSSIVEIQILMVELQIWQAGAADIGG